MSGPASIHELDRVVLRSAAIGFGPAGEPVRVSAGTAGTVVSETPGSDWVEIEVVDPSSGVPAAFVEVRRTDLRRIAEHQAA